MLYQCQNASCLHTFTHPAKLVESYVNVKEDIDRLYSMTITNESVPLHKEWTDVHLLASSLRHRIIEGDVETFVCPFCRSNDFSEYVDLEADIVSVKSVDLNEVDTYLKDGYVVEAMFAKTATIKKLAVKETPQQAEDKFTEDAKIYYSKLHPGETTQ